MVSSPTLLADQLDRWAEEDRVGIVETAAGIVVSRLDEAGVRLLVSLLAALEWRFSIDDGAFQPITLEMVDSDMGPYILTVEKPVAEGIARIVTLEGLRQVLRDDGAAGSFELAGVRSGFATGIAAFNPWGSGEIFAPSIETKNPRHLVRETSESSCVPTDVRRWLVRAVPTEKLWADRAFQTFASLAAVYLLRTLASEVPSADTVVFGPPRSAASFRPDELFRTMELKGFVALQAAVAWVYEDPRAAEQRHTLVGAEFSRSLRRDQLIGTTLKEAGFDMLESARLAYQLSLSALSREAIKAQGDLRKAVAEDTAKAADSTRTLANAIAVALATGIGLMAARSASSTEPWVLSAIGAVVGLYLLVVTISGWMFLHSQKRLRSQWRTRFYSFISSEDYDAMVVRPTDEAETPYHLVGVAGLCIGVMMIALALTNSTPV